jgi:hypothetical protein
VNEFTNISIEGLLRALNLRAVPLQPEIAAFIALEVCTASVQRPVLVTSREVWIDLQGNVSIFSDKPIVESVAAASGVVDLLCDLLLASAHGVPPSLLELVDEQVPESSRTLEQLRDQLEASLVPLNRAASQRVLARLMREIVREVERTNPSQASGANFEELDRQFDALMAQEPAPKKKSPTSG